jgi:hypothetical protein
MASFVYLRISPLFSVILLSTFLAKVQIKNAAAESEPAAALPAGARFYR